MIGKPKFTGILAYLAGLGLFCVMGQSGCGGDSKTLTVEYRRGSYNLQLIAVISIGPNANTYSANLAPIAYDGGSQFAFFGRETTSSGSVVEGNIEKIKQCAVFESRVSGTPELDPNDFVGGNVTSSSSCNEAGNGPGGDGTGFFRRAFTTGVTVNDPLTMGAFELSDSSNGFALVLFFNNSEGGFRGSSVATSDRRCFQICARKVVNKQFYSARSQGLSDVLNCDLNSLACYDF